MAVTFAIVALALGVARLAMFIALHVVRSGYNPIEHAVSNYAVGPTRKLSSVMTWTTAAMWAALAFSIWTGFPQWSDRVPVTICLGVLALIFMALPFFPTDLEGSKTTTIGRIHLLAAIAWFALSYSLMGNLTRWFAGGAFGGILSILSWITLCALVVLIAALVIRPLRSRVFGISERVFILAVNIFYVLIAVAIAFGS